MTQLNQGPWGASRQPRWARPGLVVVAVCIHLGAAAARPAADGSELTPQHRDLLEFITNRPPIARVEMILSGYYHVALPYPPRPPLQPVRLTASLQPRGFYWHISRDPNLRQPEWTGASSNLFWQLTPTLLSTAPREGPGASPANRTATMADWAWKRLNEHLQFGLDWVSGVRFADPTHFHGWHGSPQFPIEGELVLNPAGIPVRSRYAGRRGEEEFRVEAVFGEWALFDGGRRWLPRQVVYRRYERFSTPPRGPFGTRCTNRLVLLETGLLPDQGAGFQPGLFMAATDPPREVWADSNGVIYIATPTGWTKYPEVEVDLGSPTIGGPEKELWLERRRRQFRIYLAVLAGVALSGAALWGCAMARRRRSRLLPASTEPETTKPKTDIGGKP